MISPFGVLIAVCLVATGLTVLVLWHPGMIPAAVGVWTLGIVLVPAARAGRFDWLSSWTMGALSMLIGLTLRGFYVSAGFPDETTLDEMYWLGKAPTCFAWPGLLLLASLGLFAAGFGVPTARKVARCLSWDQSRLYPVAWLLLGLSLVGTVAYIILTRDSASGLLSAKRTVIPDLELTGSGYLSFGWARFLASFGFFGHLLVLGDALGEESRSQKAKLVFSGLLFVCSAIVPIYASLRGTVAMNALLSLALIYHLRPSVAKWVAVPGLFLVAVLVQSMTLLRVERDSAGAWERFHPGWEAFDSVVMNRNQIDLFKTAHIMNAVPEELPYAWGRTIAVWALSPVPREIWPGKPVTQPGPEIGAVVYDQRVAGVPPGLVAEGYWNFGWLGALGLCWLAGKGLHALESRFRPLPGEPGPRFLVYLVGVFPFAFHVLGNSIGMGLHRFVMDTVLMWGICRLACRPLP